jgi:putative selenate reductase
MTYESEPVSADLPGLVVRDGTMMVTTTGRRFQAEQQLQIAVLTDVCNECGNCVTACPTSGSPYRDKPRLYLDRADFLAQDSNAFMRLGDGVMEGRFDGRTHRIEVNGRIAYHGPAFSATLEPTTLELLEATPAGAAEGEELSLEPAAVMATLLAGLDRSMPHIPVAVGGGTFVVEPALPAR